ncbi:MAG TPA: acylneuraminate cytidylyltransferase family protein, partial [Burkholderiales bacterium]|nr:acylneuraminate cytidylyltransferase family protein [Burkholderiales bacterium]
MSIVAVIPARGGSKGIPGKNIIDFCGKPLIAWSIEQALNAEGVDGVWVTSDSEEILDVSARYGASPIRRPENIAGDAATSESAWLHALDELEKQGVEVEAMIGMQATSPVRESKDLENGVMTFRSGGCDSIFSASPLGDFLIWEKKRDASYASVNYDYENRKRRQDVSEQYVENGSF